MLVQQGYYPSREKARAAIMAGIVFVDGQRSDKAGNQIREDQIITVKGDACPYVSRGGLKLEKALEAFGIDVTGDRCMDIGASTGGFTDCMLQHGAKQVYAVDVGYGQLDYKLRQDPRVINMEKCNFRYFETEELAQSMDLITIDVSFISLALIFPVASQLLRPDGHMISLVKPQFEAGREQVGKKGIVRDPAVHREVLCKAAAAAEAHGLYVEEMTFSPVTGTKGNIEYLFHLSKQEKIEYNIDDFGVARLVEQAHETLRG